MTKQSVYEFLDQFSINFNLPKKEHMFRKVTSYLTKQEIEEVHNAFKLFDQDSSGSISIREFDQILKSLGQNLRQQELEMIIQKIDRDGNGFIDFDQFLYLVAPKIISNRSEKSFVQAFRMIDVNNKGQLGVIQLEKANLVSGAGLSSEDLIQIQQYVKQKFNGKLNIDVMLKMLQRMPDNFDQQF